MHRESSAFSFLQSHFFRSLIETKLVSLSHQGSGVSPSLLSSMPYFLRTFSIYPFLWQSKNTSRTISVYLNAENQRCMTKIFHLKILFWNLLASYNKYVLLLASKISLPYKTRKYTYSHKTYDISNHQPNSPQNQTRWSLDKIWNTIVENLALANTWIS